MEIKKADYDTFGPFQLGLASKPLESKEFKRFWGTVEHARKNLKEAIGVYLLTIGTGDTSLPIYVGKAQHGFDERLKPVHHALRLARNQYPNEVISVFLLARVSSKRREFTRKRKNSDDELNSINELEILLIRDCISRGIELLNTSGKIFFERLSVRGYLHDDDLIQDEASNALRKALSGKRSAP